MWRRLQPAGSRLFSTRRADKSLGAAGRSACATKTGSWQFPRHQEFGGSGAAACWGRYNSSQWTARGHFRGFPSPGRSDRRPSMRCWSYFFLIASLAAQQTGEVTSRDETPTFQSSVNLVRVPVVVRDKAGHTVGGLQKSDFHLTDIGKPQEIAQFAVEGSAVAKPTERQTKAEIPDEPAAAAKPVAPTRFVAFVFDDVHLTTDELANVRVAALKHVAQGLPPEERVGILTLSGTVSLELTNDLAKFRETLAKIAAIPPRTHFPPASFYMAAQFIRSPGDESLGCSSTPAGVITCDPRMPPVLATQTSVAADCLHLTGFQIQEAPPIARATLRAVYNDGASEAANGFHILNKIVR